MENKLPAISNSSVSTYCVHTGLSVNGTFKAQSGFNYVAGIREVKGLIIVEAVAEGIGCTYLCGIRILNKSDNVLLGEIDVPRNEYYSRKKCSELVSEKLLEVIEASSARVGKTIDQSSTRQKIDKILDDCYFKQSRISVLSWAESLNII